MIKCCATCKYIVDNKCSATMHPFVDCIPGDEPLPYLLWEPMNERSDVDQAFEPKQRIKELEERIRLSLVAEIMKAYDEGYDKGFRDGLNEKEQELS